MVKIVTDGTVENKIVCQKCNSELSYTNQDVRHLNIFNEETKVTTPKNNIICPKCGTIVYVP